MARRAHGGRTEIIIALIGLAGVVVAATIANWDEIFGDERAAAAPASAEPSVAAPQAEVPVNSVRSFTEAQKNALDATTKALNDIAAQIAGTSANQSAER